MTRPRPLHTAAAALERAEERLRHCRTFGYSVKMHSRAWKEVYVPRYEWHLEWRDYGREVQIELLHKRR